MPAQYAASFNGSSNYLFRSNFTGNPSAFTVSQWVFLNAAQSARTFFGNSASPTGTGWATGISDTTSNVVKFYLGSNTLSGATTLPTGTWAFVVCTYDGTTARIYLNGSTTADASLASAINYGTVPGGNYVGQASDSTQFLNGSLAALGYWSRALSGTEAASLYNGGKGMAYADLSGSLLTSLVDYYDFADASSLGLDSAPAGNTLSDVGAARANGPDAAYDGTILAESGLVGYWKLDETSGTMALDSVGTHNGTYSGGYTLGQAGVSDTAVKFDGTGNVATSVITSGLPTGTGPVTIEAWFKVNSYVGSGYTDICGYGAYSNNQAMWLGFYGDGNTVYVTFYSTLVTAATRGYNDGLYHHLVVSYDGATAHLYFDGLLVKTQAMTVNLAFGGKPFTIGSGYSGNNKINGTMDGVAVYNTALPAASVLAHYQAVYPAPAADTSSYHSTVAGTTGLVSYWPLNETAGDVAYDVVGNNNLSYQGNYTLGQASGISGTSVLMAGTVDAGAGATASSGTPPVTTATNVSWEVWFKLTNTTTGHLRLMQHNNFEFGVNGYNGGYVSDGSVYLYNSGTWNINISVKILDAKWHHMVVTVDGSGVERMYLDGSLAWTLSGVTYPAPGAGWKWGNGVQGNLDEAAVYNTTLSAATILAHYNAGNPYVSQGTFRRVGMDGGFPSFLYSGGF